VRTSFIFGLLISIVVVRAALAKLKDSARAAFGYIDRNTVRNDISPAR